MEKKIAVIGGGPIMVRNLTNEDIKLIEEGKPTEVKFPIFNTHYIDEDYGLSKKQKAQTIIPVRTEPKIGRNEKCPCGSNKKYKNCCLTT